MSYDVNLYETKPVEVATTNYTYNVSEMLVLAFNDDCGIRRIDGRRAQDVLPLVEQAAKAMHEHVEWDSMNPSNGWGTRAGAADWLDRIAAQLREHPDAIVRIE